MDKDSVIQKSVRIDTLRKEVARLGEVQRELRSLERELDVLLGLQAATVREPDDSLMARILDLLDSHPTQDYDAEELRAEWPNEQIASIRSALSRASGLKRVVRTTRGRYKSTKGPAQENPQDEPKEMQLVA